jgi:hypothetical protein
MTNYIICIPSLSRYNLISKLTLNTLESHNIPKNQIKIFVIQEEYDLYKSNIDENYEIITGVKGLVRQRKFIEDYFPVGTHIVFLDDDIKSIDLSLDGTLNLDSFILKAFSDCIYKGSFIWSVYPVFNKYFREKRESVSECLNLLIGAFYGIINRPHEEDLKNQVCITGNKEDVERSILYYKKDGIVLRYNRIGFETKYYGNDGGGLGTLKARLPSIIEETNKLVEYYPDYGKRRIRKNGIHEFVLYKHKQCESQAFKPSGEQPFNPLPIDPYEFADLYNMLECITLPMKSDLSKNSRHGFNRHRAGIFGITRQKFTGKVCDSSLTQKYPDIWKEIKRIGKLICPFEFSSVHLNHNVVCPKHLDSKNIGLSLLVSFGDYDGCNIVINNVEYNTNCNPIIFDGSKLEHYNTPLLSGNKYSLVYYNFVKVAK